MLIETVCRDHKTLIKLFVESDVVHLKLYFVFCFPPIFSCSRELEMNGSNNNVSKN